ncbi:MFS transporter [Streptomyces sp. NPDC017979]|uniref:MFS transporter n=1 Tax=Streptomyces sp. NPDC017979 TaxID=3365024 RepID=UPI00379572F4
MAVDRGLSTANPPSPPRRRVDRRAWIIVVTLFFFMLLSYADKVVVGLAGVEMIRDIGIDSGQFGVVQSSFFWLYALGAVLGSVLVGRFPARWLLGAVALIWVISLLPMIWSTSFAVLIVSRMLLGFAEGPTAAMAFGVTHSWFPAEKRALPTSVVAAGASFGPIAAAPVITAVVLEYDWHAAFAVTAAAGLVWVVVWFAMGRDGPEKAAEVPTPSSRLPERVPYRALLTSGTVIGIAVLFFVTYCSTAIKVSWLPLYLREGLGYDAVTAGRLITLPYLAGAVMMVVTGVVSRALTKRGVSNRLARGVLGSVLVLAGGASTVAFAVLDRGTLQMSLIIAGAALSGAAQGVVWAALSDVIPPKQRGTVIGFVVAFYSMGGVIGPLLLGRLLDGAATPSAGYAQGFTLLGVVMIVGSLVAARLIDPERNAAAFVAAYGGAARTD